MMMRGALVVIGGGLVMLAALVRLRAHIAVLLLGELTAKRLLPKSDTRVNARSGGVHARGAEMFRRGAVVPAPGVRLFGHARLAQALADPLVLLPVFRARKCEGDRRQATECGYPRVRISLLVDGERGSRLVGAIQERVGRGQESVG